MTNLLKEISINSPNFQQDIKKTKNSGQVLVEFVLLFVVLAGLSMFMVKFVNGNLSERWKSIVQAIVKPTDTQIRLR